MEKSLPGECGDYRTVAFVEVGDSVKMVNPRRLPESNSFLVSALGILG